MFENLKDIRLFVAAYEERSFTLAAEREHATQSGVSQRMRKLEDQMGVKFFIRGLGVAVRPTPAGDAYYRNCITILRAHDAMQENMRQFSEGLDGEVRVGMSPSATRSILVAAHTRFSALHPNVDIKITEAYTGALTEKLRAGQLDFVLGVAPPNEVGVLTTPFARTPDLLVAGPSSGLKHGAPVRLADLGPLHLVVPYALHARRAHVDAYIAASGARVERVMELDSVSSTLCFVEGGWMTILPALAMLPELHRPGRVILCPLVDPTMTLELTIMELARRPLSTAAAAFLEVLREEVRTATDTVKQLIG